MEGKHHEPPEGEGYQATNLPPLPPPTQPVSAECLAAAAAAAAAATATATAVATGAAAVAVASENGPPKPIPLKRGTDSTGGSMGGLVVVPSGTKG